MTDGPGQFDLVVFDFDGTLASSLDGITACLGQALRRFGFPAPSIEDVKSTVGLTLEESIGTLTNGRCHGAELQEVVRAYRDLHASEAAPLITLFDGVQDLLALVVAIGMKSVL